MNRFSLQTVALPRRAALQYAEQGVPRGVPVLFLHGITDSWRSFERVLPHLPPSLRAFAISQRGHGDSERPASGYRTRDFAADLAAFTEALGLGPAIVVGHSMGSTNAKRFAIDFPGRVRGLLLAGAFASYGDKAGLRDFFAASVHELTDPVAEAFAREFQESTLARPVPAPFLDMVVAESLKVPARVWRAAFAGLFEDDFAAELRAVEAPTRLVWGDRDALASRGDQDRLCAGIRGARLTVYAGHGHAPHWEAPERFAADVASFASEIA